MLVKHITLRDNNTLFFRRVSLVRKIDKTITQMHGYSREEMEPLSQGPFGGLCIVCQ